MIAEAVDTAVTVAWALLAWIAAMAVVGTVVLYAVAVTVWAVPAAACRAVTGALAASRALRDLGARPERYRPPQRPAWAAA